MKIKTIDLQSADSGKNFADSMHKTGFAILENHNISLELLRKVYEEWDDFFNSEAKNQYPHDNKKQDGFIPIDKSEIAKGHKLKDLKEFYHLYFPWGRYPAEITKLTEELFYGLIEMAKQLLFWLEINCPSHVAIGFKEPLSRVVSIEKSLFRMIHYPPLRGDEYSGAVRAAPHEDINLITLLPAATGKGLQVRDHKGEWHDIGTDFGQIVVNVGDMLQECSKNYYQSTTHRVINPEYATNEPRMSMPLFLHPRGDFYLSERYNKAQNYLEERLEELGLV